MNIIIMFLVNLGYMMEEQYTKIDINSNKFRDMCRSIQLAGEECMREIIRLDEKSRSEVNCIYKNLGINLKEK